MYLNPYEVLTTAQRAAVRKVNANTSLGHTATACIVVTMKAPKHCKLNPKLFKIPAKQDNGFKVTSI